MNARLPVELGHAKEWMKAGLVTGAFASMVAGIVVSAAGLVFETKADARGTRVYVEYLACRAVFEDAGLKSSDCTRLYNIDAREFLTVGEP